MAKVRMLIKKFCKEHGWDYNDLARHSGVMPTTARVHYHGIAERIDLDTLGYMAAALGVEPGRLFEWDKSDETN